MYAWSRALGFPRTSFPPTMRIASQELARSIHNNSRPFSLFNVHMAQQEIMARQTAVGRLLRRSCKDRWSLCALGNPVKLPSRSANRIARACTSSLLQLQFLSVDMVKNLQRRYLIACCRKTVAEELQAMSGRPSPKPPSAALEPRDS